MDCAVESSVDENNAEDKCMREIILWGADARGSKGDDGMYMYMYKDNVRMVVYSG